MKDTSSEQVITRRLPWLAAILALLGPGLGHLYSGRLPQAILWALIFVVFANAFFVLLVNESISQANLFIFVTVEFIICLLHAALAFRVAKQQGDNFAPQRYNQWYYYIIWWLSVAFVVLFTAPQFGNYRIFVSPSQSMETALMYNERLVADMDAYKRQGPLRGDVAIFICPCDGTTLYLKRCLAVPGDTIEIVDKKFYVNGVPVEEQPTVRYVDTTESGEWRIHPKLPGGIDSRDNFGPRAVPAGEYFMVGDNRDNSLDSRFFGFVPKNMILGKAIRVYLSSDWRRMWLTIE